MTAIAVDIDDEIQKVVQSVSTELNLSYNDSLLLLRYWNWDKPRAISVYNDYKKKAVLAQSGICIKNKSKNKRNYLKH